MAFKGSLTRCVIYAGGRWTNNPKELILIGRYPNSTGCIALPSNEQIHPLDQVSPLKLRPIFYGNLDLFRSLLTSAVTQTKIFQDQTVQT